MNASVGYYYQNGDLASADGSGVLGRLAYEVSSGLTAGVNISYDQEFDTRVSAEIKIHFGGQNTTRQRKEVQQLSVMNALTASPSNRGVRVHDCIFGGDWCDSVEDAVDDIADGIVCIASKTACEASDDESTGISLARRVVALELQAEDVAELVEALEGL